MTNRARIGVVGTGWWATYAHLPALVSYPLAEVAAIADPSPERLAQAAEHFGITEQYQDYRAMLDRGELDGVIVATPHNTHYTIAREVITAGALGQIQLTHSLFASMVLEYYRANPQAYADVFRWQVTGPQPSTYSDPSIAGGGQGHLQVTHSAALLLWLTDLRPREVAAFLAGFDLRVDVCDAISVRFDGGAVGTIASTGGIPTAQQAHSQLETRIYGSDGYAWLDAMAGTCSIFFNDGGVEMLDEVPAEGRYPMATTSRHLVDLILGQETTNRSPAEIGARTVELLEAAYRSAAERRIVSIDEL